MRLSHVFYGRSDLRHNIVEEYSTGRLKHPCKLLLAPVRNKLVRGHGHVWHKIVAHRQNNLARYIGNHLTALELFLIRQNTHDAPEAWASMYVHIAIQGTRHRLAIAKQCTSAVIVIVYSYAMSCAAIVTVLGLRQYVDTSGDSKVEPILCCIDNPDPRNS